MVFTGSPSMLLWALLLVLLLLVVVLLLLTLRQRLLLLLHASSSPSECRNVERRDRMSSGYMHACALQTSKDKKKKKKKSRALRKGMARQKRSFIRDVQQYSQTQGSITKSISGHFLLASTLMALHISTVKSAPRRWSLSISGKCVSIQSKNATGHRSMIGFLSRP